MCDNCRSLKKKCAMTEEETRRPGKTAAKRKRRDDDDDEDVVYVGKGKRHALQSDEAGWRNGIERRLVGIEGLLKELVSDVGSVGRDVNGLGLRIDSVMRAVVSLEHPPESDDEEQAEEQEMAEQQPEEPEVSEEVGGVTEGTGESEKVAETEMGESGEVGAEAEAEIVEDVEME